jgi:hypothetical protein
MSTVDADQTAVSGAELASFTRQLGAMLHAGVNVLRALRIASQYTGNGPLIEAARSLAKSLEDGKELHQAIGRHPELFDPFYVEMVRQGEADGTLGQTLLGVADYLDHLSLPTTHAETASAALEPPSGSSGSSGSLWNTLGILAVGAAVIGAAVASGLLDARWYLPLTSAWAAFCFLSAGRQAGPTPPAMRAVTPVTLPPQPGKSAQRRAAETEGMVRSALHEQEEEAEAGASVSAVHDLSANGRAQVAPDLLLPPDERTPPRFEL